MKWIYSRYKASVMQANCSPIIPGVVLIAVIVIAIIRYRHEIMMTALATVFGCVAIGLVWAMVTVIRHMARESRTARVIAGSAPVTYEEKVSTPVGPKQDAQLASYADLLGQEDVTLFGTGEDVIGKRVKTEQ